ncbi:hypothetical protein V8E36_006374 [Tilletia maclaganii]
MRISSSSLVSSDRRARPRVGSHAARSSDRHCVSDLCLTAVYDDQASSSEYQAVYTGTIGSIGWLPNGSPLNKHDSLPGASLHGRSSPTRKLLRPLHAFPRVLTWTFPAASGFAFSGRPARSTGAPASSEPSPPIRRHIRHGFVSFCERNRP